MIIPRGCADRAVSLLSHMPEETYFPLLGSNSLLFGQGETSGSSDCVITRELTAYKI